MPKMLPDGIENEDQRIVNSRIIEEIRRLWLAIDGGGDLGDAPDGSVTEPVDPPVQWSEIIGIPASFPPDTTTSVLAGDVTGSLSVSVIAPLAVTDSKVNDVGWAKITGAPATFPPSSHTHPPSQIVSLTLNNLIIGDASNLGSGLAAPTGSARALNWDGTNVSWTDKFGYSSGSGYIEATDDIAIRGGSIILSGGSAGAAATTASSGQGFGAMYTTTRAVAWRWDGTVYALADGVLGSLDGVVEYTPSATAASRKVDAKCDINVGTSSQGQLLRVYYGTGGKYVEVAKATGVVTIKGASADIVIDPALVDAAGKAMSLREIDVCDSGVAKKQLILASAPYT